MEAFEIGMTGNELVNSLNSNNYLLNNWFNVKNYGAKGDNNTDDTASIQAAIDACDTAGGGIVYFPNGIYILSGALQTSYDGVAQNSQLVIPPRKNSEQRVSIKFLGESNYCLIPSSFWENPVLNTQGVILKSTIGSIATPPAQSVLGMPSVIGTRGALTELGLMNPSTVIFENITVMVNSFNTTTGSQLTAINMYYCSQSHYKNVMCTTDCLSKDTLAPANHNFGVIMSPLNCFLFSTIDNLQCSGFWCGLAVGEGVVANNVGLFGNYYGLIQMPNVIGSKFNYLACHANKFAIAAPPERIITEAADARLIIDYFSLEHSTINKPEWWATWYAYEDVIYDPNNYIFGEFGGNMNYPSHGSYFNRANGGTNLLYRNKHVNSDYVWVTADRPANPGLGCKGFNMTTNKLEVWDGSQWQNCF